MPIELPKTNKGKIYSWSLDASNPDCPMVLGYLEYMPDEFQFIHTSRVLTVDFETHTIETLNSFYTLAGRLPLTKANDVAYVSEG